MILNYVWLGLNLKQNLSIADWTFNTSTQYLRYCKLLRPTVLWLIWFYCVLTFFPTSSKVIVFLENKFQNRYALTLRLEMRWTYSSNAVHRKLSPKHWYILYGSKQCYGLIAAVHLCAVSQCAGSGEAMSCQVMLYYELQIYGQTSASACVREKRNKNLTRRHAGGIKTESLHKNRLQTL